MLGQIDQLKARLRSVCLTVLSMVLLAYRPLHLFEMRHITNMARVPDIERAVALCGSFLTVRDKYVYLIHQSAKDHLDRLQATTAILQEHSAIHYKMYSQSLRALSENLRRNIYELSDPGISSSKIAALSPDPDPLFDLRYCCMYWLNHFLEMDPASAKEQEIHFFFKEHLLHWLESLSLMGEVRHGILTLKKLVHLQQIREIKRRSKLRSKLL
ncbi:hypothetical protein BJX63DRAFT_381888 [Aspergillus granulosus]|uniref:Uncharacterized protein n=1 Tax=Aspergillus granulosus TaxID=176169 RepID=A0ABR4HV58_9EURO